MEHKSDLTTYISPEGRVFKISFKEVKPKPAQTSIKTSSTDYKYPHDYKGAYVKQQYLPDKLKNKKYYQPKDIGYEKQIKEIYDRLEKIKNK